MSQAQTQDKEAPNHRYYRLCHGAWSSVMESEVTDWRALQQALGLLNATAFRLLSRWPRWLGPIKMHTTLAYDGSTLVHHTTRISWLGLPLSWSKETIQLDTDGRRLTMDLRARFLMAPWMTIHAGGPGELDETGQKATYHVDIMGAKMLQTTLRQDDQVTITQTLPGYRATIPLRRTHKTLSSK